MTEPAIKRRDDVPGDRAPVIVAATLPQIIVSVVVDALHDAGFDVVPTQSVDEAQAALASRPASALILYYPLEPQYSDWVTSLRNAEAHPTRRILLLCNAEHLEAAGAARIGDLVNAWNVPRNVLIQNAEILTRLAVLEQSQTSADTPLRDNDDDALWRAVTNGVPVGLLVIDDAAHVIASNQAAADLLAVPLTQLTQSNLTALLGSGIEFRFPDTNPDDVWIHGDFVRTRKNEILEIDYLARKSILPGRHVIVLQDATERNRRSAMQSRAEKLDSMGRLVGGMAHEFNNLLTVILGYSDLSIKLAAVDSRFSDALTQIKNSAERGAHLTQLLLAFGRKQVMAPVWIELNRLVHDLGVHIRQILDERIEVTLNLGEGLPRIFVDPILVQRVLTQLVANAQDAMPDGGTLNVTTSLIDVDSTMAALIPELQPGRYVCMSIQDSGPGIPGEIKPFIFEPFFTTKSVGKGTGMGLAYVEGVMHQSGGGLDVQSEPGAGATVRLFFSTVAAIASTRQSPPTAVEGPPRVATILWVDDDDAVRKFGSLVLRSHGYQVLEAANGALALALVQANLGKINLVITDVYMPVMGGVELGTRLEAEHPGLPILYQSGRLEDMRQTQSGQERTLQFLAKPFTRESLLAKISQLLRTHAD